MHKYAPDGRDVTTEDQDIGIARIPGTPVVASELDRSTISNAESPESPQTHVHSHAGSLPVVGVSPPDLGQQGWWDSSSPLSIAVRRRDFLLQNTERRVNANNLAPRAQPNDRRSSSSLRSLDSLEIVNGPATNLKLRDKREDLATKEAPAAERESGVSHSPKTKWNQEKASLEVGENNGPPETPAKFPDSYSSTGCDPFIFPRVSEEDKRLELSTKNLITQRTVFGFIVLAINIGCLVGTLKSQKHLWVLIMILVAKTKDISSTLIQIVWFIFRIFFKRKIKLDASAKWILTCITAYAESEEQIMRTINSILDNAYQPHKIVMVIILDGKPQTILRNFSGVAQTSRRPYQTWRFAHNEANLYAGTIKEIPVIMIEKIGNVGKKDSLILCHDLFNHMRANVPEPTRQLRADIWTKILPKIIPTDLPERFDYLFFADADSVIHAGALSHLAMALTQEPDSIAACGLVLAEMTIDNTWSMWYQYQQFQYTYGQLIRRNTESIWGRVTCLPGCITMVKNRPDMAGAIQLFASPITDSLVLKHQVQYLGTDRRLTWCMLEQSKHLKTLFVPKATSQTVAPQSFTHYMSQRRRWGSNAYFNDVCYMIGVNSWLITRLWGLIDLIRQTLVYYRLANTILFAYDLSRHFVLIKFVPYIVVTQTPTIWFVFIVLFREPMLRRMAHKLFAGWLINKIISPILSILIFSRIILNLGNAVPVWGRTGNSNYATNVPDIIQSLTPRGTWTPTGIVSLVRETIKGRKMPRSKSELTHVASVDDEGEPIPPPATKVIAGRPGTTSYSPATPKTPRQAHILANEPGSLGTVKRYKLFSDI